MPLPNNQFCIVWRFEDAPKELQQLSDNGGDEDWLVVYDPEKYPYVPMWLESTDTCMDPQIIDHPTEKGLKVIIGSHS